MHLVMLEMGVGKYISINLFYTVLSNNILVKVNHKLVMFIK